MRAVAEPNIVTNAEDLTALVDAYLQRPAFAYDLETIGDKRLNTRQNKVAVVALATDGRHDVVPIEFPNGKLDHIEYPLTLSGRRRKAIFEQQGKEFTPRKGEYSVDIKKATYHWTAPPEHLEEEQAWDILRPLLVSDRLKVGHNLKYDLSSVHKYLKQFPEPPYADTMVAAYLVNSNWRPSSVGTPYGLAAVTHRETDILMKKGVGENIAIHSWHEVMRYAGLDVKYTWLAWRMLRRKIEKRGLRRVFDLEMDILRVLLDMERVGAPIDQQALRALDEQMANPRNGLLVQAESKVYGLAGRKFPLGSSNEKVKLLFGPKSEGGQGLEPRKYTAKSTEDDMRASVSAEALEYYRLKNKLVAALLEYADLAKLHSTYVRTYIDGIKVRGVDGLVPLIEDGRIHAEFNQIGAQTGRFSCRAPNLQNVPAPTTDMGRAIRGLFIAPPGHKLVVADFSQIELRVLAHFSKDPALMRAFLEGEDIHQATADALGMSRKGGKAMNFTIVFSGGPDLVADRAGITQAQARKFMKRFDEHYAGINRWRNAVIADCRRQKPVPCVRTLLGRVRYLPNINSPEQGWRAGAERQAGNTVIQGSAADIIKLSMVRAHRALPEGCDLILTVHDELVTIAPDVLADDVAQLISEAMTGAYELAVPLPADVKIVNRWSEAK